jgi:methionine sulfoxide reductase heme-binding subunit
MIAAASASTPVPIAWLVARAAGLSALAILSASVWLGLAMSVRLFAPARQKALMGWHQTLMWCGLSLVALHALALLLDPVMRFSIAVVLVPGLAPWRPTAVAAGVVAGWLMLALAVSFHLRRRMTQRRWRLLHYLGFAAFACGLGHGLTAGTDLRSTTGLLVAGGLAAPAVWLVYARILVPRATAAGRRPPRPAGAS